MASQLNKSSLRIALSDLFVDSETDYEYIARIAKDYPLPEVEFELFERVAPVCLGNMFSPVPPIWGGFNEEKLISDIEEYSRKCSVQGGAGKAKSYIYRCFIRIYCAGLWSRLKEEIEVQRMQ